MTIDQLVFVDDLALSTRKNCAKMLLKVLTFAVAVSTAQALSSLDLITYKREADGFGSPLTASALDRLTGPIFGTSRTARSMDVVLFNKTPKEFKLGNIFCANGNFSAQMLPDPLLPAKSTIVFGMEGADGVDCHLKYEMSSQDEDVYFHLQLLHPLRGSKSYQTTQTPDLLLDGKIQPGANGITRIYLAENPNYVPGEFEEEEA